MESNGLSSTDLSEKELKIIDSAIKIFSEKGYSATTTNEIAKDAGVAEGTIFRYFKTKKDILRGIVIQCINLSSSNLVMAPVERILLNSEGKELRAVLKELLYDRMKLIDKIFPMARVIMTEALYHEDVREALYENIISKVMETFKVFHVRMVEKGMIRGDIDGDTILRAILGNMVVFMGQRKFYGDKFEIQDLDQAFDKMLDVLLFGIAQPAKKS